MTSSTPIVRRWDDRPIPADRAARSDPLDDGVEVTSRGRASASGDYWLIAARTSDGSVTWPDASAAAEWQPPHGVEVHR